ncbi:MAG TPA: YraN family protein [Vicinamibacterales bacterium]|nr:YraN family protein [Vicinamibacterales bacterium]
MQRRCSVSDARVSLGKTGEDLAVAELERRGYEILARRYRRRGGEIDIIARDRETTVFVEVKTRENGEFGDGWEAVRGWKQRRMAGVAMDYAARNGLIDTRCRFDVVSIQFGSDGPAIEVYQNAFDAASR